MEVNTPQGVKTERMRLTYPQAWSAYNSAKTNEITLFDSLLRDLVQVIGEPEYSFGRPNLASGTWLSAASRRLTASYPPAALFPCLAGLRRSKR